MKNGFSKQVTFYLRDHKLRKKLISIICALSVFTVFTVYGSLMQPAISMENNNIILEAEPAQTSFDQELGAVVYAEALKNHPETIFLISTESVGAGLSDEYAFTDNSTEIVAESGTKITLNRYLDEQGVWNYWFSLSEGEVETFILKCIDKEVIDEDISDVTSDESANLEEEGEKVEDEKDAETEAANSNEINTEENKNESNTQSEAVADNPEQGNTNSDAGIAEEQNDESNNTKEESEKSQDDSLISKSSDEAGEKSSDSDNKGIIDVETHEYEKGDVYVEPSPEKAIQINDTINEDINSEETSTESTDNSNNTLSDDQLKEKELKLYSVSAPSLDEAKSAMEEYKNDKEVDPLILTWMDKDVLDAMDISEITLSTEKKSGVFGEELSADVYAHASEFAKDDVTFVIKQSKNGANLTDEFLFVDGIYTIKAEDRTLIDLHLESAEDGSSYIWFKLSPGVDESFSLKYFANVNGEISDSIQKSVRLSAGYGTVLSSALESTGSCPPIAFSWSADGTYTIDYSDQTVDCTASDGAKIFVSGNLPNGTKVTAEPENDIDLGMDNVIAAYDITLLFEDKEYQPESSVIVSISLPEPKISETESPIVDVYHISSDTTEPEKICQSADLTLSENSDIADTVEFKAESFSVYIIVDGQYISMSSYSGYEINVGDTFTLYSNNGSSTNSSRHEWTSSNNEIATVTEGNPQYATLRGISAGTVTITHRYKSGGVWYQESRTIIVKENASSTLTTVDTVDSTPLGVTMKMFNYSSAATIAGDSSYHSGQNDEGETREGLIKNNLGSNGYPVVVNNNANLSTYFTNGTDANHLFIKSIYDNTGYFEYNSADNFAEFNKNSGDFTVYNQLGSPGNDNVFYLKRGNFMPFNTLNSNNIVQHNLYDYLGRQLTASDPRYNEPIYGFNQNPDYYFGMSMEADFLQPKDGIVDDNEMIFEFTGDDDMWIFIDDKLVLDLGGIHNAQSGSINFATGVVRWTDTPTRLNSTPVWKETTIREMFRQAGLSNTALNDLFEKDGDIYRFKDYSTHSLKMFYMERGAGASNLRIKFNLPTIPKKSVQVKKIASGATLDQFDDYTMKLYINEDGIGTDYVAADNHAYSIGSNSYTTSSNGTFTIKSGQTATFSNIPENATYYIEELNTSEFDVTFNGEAGNKVGSTDTFKSNNYNASTTPVATVNNTAKTGSLTLKKYGTADGGTTLKKLENVQFSLFTAEVDGDSWEKEDDEAFASGRTDSNGLVEFNNLPLGNYLLYETDTPSGYVNPLEAWKVVVTADSATVYFKSGSEWLTIPNESGSYKIINYEAYGLPDTGGDGLKLIYMIGSILILLGGFIFLSKKKQWIR